MKLILFFFLHRLLNDLEGKERMRERETEREKKTKSRDQGSPSEHDELLHAWLNVLQKMTAGNEHQERVE